VTPGQDRLVHFLLVFDHQAGHLIDQIAFEDGEQAVAAYAAKESEYQGPSRPLRWF
jgi:hypothetical protein